MGIINQSTRNILVVLGHNGDIIVVDEADSVIAKDAIVVEPGQDLSWGITLEDKRK